MDQDQCINLYIKDKEIEYKIYNNKINAIEKIYINKITKKKNIKYNEIENKYKYNKSNDKYFKDNINKYFKVNVIMILIIMLNK